MDTILINPDRINELRIHSDAHVQISIRTDFEYELNCTQYSYLKEGINVFCLCQVPELFSPEKGLRPLIYMPGKGRFQDSNIIQIDVVEFWRYKLEENETFSPDNDDNLTVFYTLKPRFSTLSLRILSIGRIKHSELLTFKCNNDTKLKLGLIGIRQNLQICIRWRTFCLCKCSNMRI